MKTCIKCNIEKELEDYNKSPSHKDGFKNICKLCRKEYNKQNRENNKAYLIEWNLENKKHVLNYNELNKDKRKEYTKQYDKLYKPLRYKNNIQHKMALILRGRLLKVLKYQKVYKTESVLNFLGCSLDEFKVYIEKQFLPEMNWLNYGEIWEIDHKIACAKFDLTKFEEQQKCFHFSNHQPLFKTTKIAESFGYTDQIGNRNKSNK